MKIPNSPDFDGQIVVSGGFGPFSATEKYNIRRRNGSKWEVQRATYSKQLEEWKSLESLRDEIEKNKSMIQSCRIQDPAGDRYLHHFNVEQLRSMNSNEAEALVISALDNVARAEFKRLNPDAQEELSPPAQSTQPAQQTSRLSPSLKAMAIIKASVAIKEKIFGPSRTANAPEKVVEPVGKEIEYTLGIRNSTTGESLRSIPVKQTAQGEHLCIPKNSQAWQNPGVIRNYFQSNNTGNIEAIINGQKVPLGRATLEKINASSDPVQALLNTTANVARKISPSAAAQKAPIPEKTPVAAASPAASSPQKTPESSRENSVRVSGAAIALGQLVHQKFFKSSNNPERVASPSGKEIEYTLGIRNGTRGESLLPIRVKQTAQGEYVCISRSRALKDPNGWQDTGIIKDYFQSNNTGNIEVIINRQKVPLGKATLEKINASPDPVRALLDTTTNMARKIPPPSPSKTITPAPIAAVPVAAATMAAAAPAVKAESTPQPQRQPQPLTPTKTLTQETRTQTPSPTPSPSAAQKVVPITAAPSWRSQEAKPPQSTFVPQSTEKTPQKTETLSENPHDHSSNPLPTRTFSENEDHFQSVPPPVASNSNIKTASPYLLSLQKGKETLELQMRVTPEGTHEVKIPSPSGMGELWTSDLDRLKKGVNIGEFNNIVIKQGEKEFALKPDSLQSLQQTQSPWDSLLGVTRNKVNSLSEKEPVRSQRTLSFPKSPQQSAPDISRDRQPNITPPETPQVYAA